MSGLNNSQNQRDYLSTDMAPILSVVNVVSLFLIYIFLTAGICSKLTIKTPEQCLKSVQS